MIIVNLSIILLSFIALVFSSCTEKTFSIQRSMLLKAILPYGIILGHISSYNTNVFSIAIVGSFIVGVFFFISAYGLECKRQIGNITIKDLWRRLIKLLGPLIIPIIVYFVVLTLKGENALSIIYGNITSYQFIIPYTWFVIILAIFYTFFYVLSAFKISNKRFVLILTICICLFSLVNFTMFRNSAYTNFSSLCFPAGVLYRQYETKIKYFLSKKYNYLICFAVLLVTGLFDHVHYLLPFTILIWSIMIIMLSTLFNVSGNKVLKFFSNISYEVYLCQGITYIFIPQHFDKYPAILHIALTIALTILIAVICHIAFLGVRALLSSSHLRKTKGDKKFDKC